MYNPILTRKMSEELTSQGIIELKISQEVEDIFQKETDFIIFVNSICGCSARSARPALLRSLKHRFCPKKVFTVFAGVDPEAVTAAREYITGYQSSSPSIAFFKQKELVCMIERHQIEGYDADTLVDFLESVYEKYYSGDVIREDVRLRDPSAVEEVSPLELKKMMDEHQVTVIDCRQKPEQIEKARIDGSYLLTDPATEEHLYQLSKKEAMIVCHCNHGNSSKQAVQFLKKEGYERVYSLKGGLHAWEQDIHHRTLPY